MGKLISSDCNRRSEREDGAGGSGWGSVYSDHTAS